MSVCKCKCRPTFTLECVSYPVRILNGCTVIGFKFRQMSSENICTLDMRKRRDSSGLMSGREKGGWYEGDLVGTWRSGDSKEEWERRAAWLDHRA